MNRPSGRVLTTLCRALFAFAAFLAASLPTAPAGETTTPAPARISFVMRTFDGAFWQAVRTGAEEEMRRLQDAAVRFNAPSRQVLVREQINRIADEVAAGADVLIVAPCAEEEMIPVFEDLHREGYPVILVDSDMPWPNKTSFVGSNNYHGGYLVAERVAQELRGVGGVAILAGTTSSRPSRNRVRGARAAFATYPGIRVVEEYTGNWEYDTARNAVEAALAGHPDLDAIFCCSDEMAFAALDALEAHGKTALVAGFDGTDRAVHLVRQGKLLATVRQNARLIGILAVRAAYMTARGRPIPPHIDTGVELVTLETLTGLKRQ